MPSISFESLAHGSFVECLVKFVAALLKYVISVESTPILLYTIENECKHLSIVVGTLKVLLIFKIATKRKIQIHSELAPFVCAHLTRNFSQPRL